MVNPDSLKVSTLQTGSRSAKIRESTTTDTNGNHSNRRSDQQLPRQSVTGGTQVGMLGYEKERTLRILYRQGRV